MDVVRPTFFATTPYDVVTDYLDWHHWVSQPRLVPPHRGEVRQVPTLVYDERLSFSWLSFISCELRRYLHRLEAEEDHNDFVEVFRALRIAQEGSLPQGGPITNSGTVDDD